MKFVLIRLLILLAEVQAVMEVFHGAVVVEEVLQIIQLITLFTL